MDLWYTSADSSGTRWCVKLRKPLASAEGRSGRVEAFESEDFGTLIAVEGSMTLTEADGFAHREMMVHPPVSAHPAPRSALILSGGDGSLALELLRYPFIERITVTEDDEAYAEAAKGFFPGLAAALSDKRVSVSGERGDSFVRDTHERFDLILLDSRASRSDWAAGQSFFCDCFRALSGDGILAVELGSAFFPERRRELVSIAGRLKRLFPIFKPYAYESPAGGSGSRIAALASKRYDPLRDFQSERWAKLGLETRYYDAELHRAAFALPRYVAEAFKGA